MENSVRDTVILGTGCSGLTAAIYAGRANLKPLVVEGHEPGGQLSLTTLVENFPGFPEGIQGPELIENMRRQAERFGTEFMHGHLVSADLTQRPFKLNFGAKTIETWTLIIASGASARYWTRCLFLRYLRRLLFQGQTHHRHRRRRLRYGRSSLSFPLCHQGDDHSSS